MNKDIKLIFEAYNNKKVESPEQKRERVARGWELNKQRWDKWKKENPEKAKLNAQRKAGIYGNKEENAEDVSSSFHYDPMGHLADAANQIKKILSSNSDDEARTEHIEKMAEIILGPQAEYSSYHEYNRVMSGVIELLNHYIVVPMNEGEEVTQQLPAATGGNQPRLS